MKFMDEFKEGLVYPFQDKDWVKKLWPLPIIAAIPLLGIFSVILLKGWRFEMVRNLAFGTKELPAFDFFKMLKRGAILWLVMIGHIFIPGVLCTILGLSGPLGLLVDMYEIITSGFSEWAKSEPSDWALTIMIYIIWGLISFPVFQSGMIRYAISGNWKDLLNVPANGLLFIRNIHHFIKFYIYWLLLLFLIFIADSMLLMTGIGLLIIPAFTVCVYYLSSAYELGELARKLNPTMQDELKLDAEQVAIE
jgi:hypothetical protein